tara:strand:- start:80 stop:445 length:366 start_codon:yes stop_codon:yes gene_type:complete
MLKTSLSLSILALLYSCQLTTVKKIACLDKEGDNVIELIFNSVTAEVYSYDSFNETLSLDKNIESVIVGDKLKVRDGFSFFEEPKLTLDLISMKGNYKYFMNNTKEIECKYIKPPSLKFSE